MIHTITLPVAACEDESNPFSSPRDLFNYFLWMKFTLTPPLVVSSININALPKGTFSHSTQHNFLLHFISPGQQSANAAAAAQRVKKKIVERFINELLVMKYRPLTIANHLPRANKLEKKSFSCCIKNCWKNENNKKNVGWAMQGKIQNNKLIKFT